MSFISQNLKLPYIAPGQSQKNVTHNEALRTLDAVVQLSLVSIIQTAPPAPPIEGERYFVASFATGDWENQDGNIAAYQDGAWAFYILQTGWLAWVADENLLMIWDGTTWQAATPAQDPQNLALLGVNTTADTTNRLSVSSPATLLNHEGNGHQVKLNKNTVADTASFLFQTGFSGRAEIGLTGDDDFSFKVSPDGSAWNTALKIDKTSGEVIVENFITLPASAKLQASENNIPFIQQRNAADTAYIDMPYLNADNRLITTTASNIVGPTPTTGPHANIFNIIQTTSGIASGTLQNLVFPNVTGRYYPLLAAGAATTDSIIAHYNNANTLTSNAVIELRTIGTGAGDPLIRYNINGGSQWQVGLDNSQNDRFVWGISALGTADKMRLETSGNLWVDGSIQAKSFTVATLPSASSPGAMIYVSDETGGGTMAFADGTNWRRMADRAVVL